jgi:hypothetical protein
MVVLQSSEKGHEELLTTPKMWESNKGLIPGTHKDLFSSWGTGKPDE